jgi:CDP-archaeol synthase
MRLWVITRLLLLVVLANAMPVIATKVLGNRFSRPLDGDLTCRDGQPLFGQSKTTRGIILSVLATVIGSFLSGLGCKTGALIGSAAMAGDLFSSFLKRRMKLPPSSRAIGLDQVPESLFPILACRRFYSLTAFDTVVAVAAFFIGEIVVSRILYKFRLRDRPY